MLSDGEFHTAIWEDGVGVLRKPERQLKLQRQRDWLKRQQRKQEKKLKERQQGRPRGRAPPITFSPPALGIHARPS